MADLFGGKKEKSAHVWARDEHDWYVEPVEATRKLLEVEGFAGPVWDPCCGGGNIVTTLVSAGYDAFGTDLIERRPGAPWFKFTLDFLGDASAPALAPNICMNPPFFKAKGAEAFIRRAIEACDGKVCAFVDIRFLAGAKRATGLFQDFPPQRIWVVTPRVSCPPGAYLEAGNKAGNGSSDWVWIVWDRSTPGAVGTQFGWLKDGANV